MARMTQAPKRSKKGKKNESNINGGRMFLLLCCKKGLVGMITGESQIGNLPLIVSLWTQFSRSVLFLLSLLSVTSTVSIFLSIYHSASLPLCSVYISLSLYPHALSTPLLSFSSWPSHSSFFSFISLSPQSVSTRGQTPLHL